MFLDRVVPIIRTKSLRVFHLRNLSGCSPTPHTRLPFMAMDPTCLPFMAMGWGEIAKTRRQCGTGEKCLRRSGSRAPLTGTARIKAEHWRTVRARSERANQRSNMLDRAATDDSRWRMGVPIVIVTRLCPHCGGSLSAIMSDVWPQMTLTFHLGCACQVRLIGDPPLSGLSRLGGAPLADSQGTALWKPRRDAGVITTCQS